MGRCARTTLSTLDFRIVDSNSPHFGVSLRRLMQNAAQALAEEVVRLRPARVLIVCGSGNNGGDGMAMACLLPPSVRVRVVLADEPRRIRQPEARWAFGQLEERRIPFEVFGDGARLRELAADADLIVDALLGSGMKGDLRDPIRSMVKVIGAAKRPVLSVDVPTGYEGRFAVRPAVTVALHGKKPALTKANAGRIVVRDIGIPPQAEAQVGPADFFVPYPRNPHGSHKGQNGRVLVVAGGPYTGAPMLCAGSALRSGVDIVRLLTPSDAARAAQVRFPDLIVHPGAEARRLVEEDVKTATKLLGIVDTLLIGPGLGDDGETTTATREILRAAAAKKVRTVIDADAIVVAGEDPALARRLRPLVTPHHGEFKEYTGKAVPKGEAAAKVVRAEAQRLRSTLLVKGPVDLVTDGARLKENHVHHPAMTTGGTGDVLAGLCAGFVAKGMEPFRAACAAAFVNGEAGRRAARGQGGSLVATDLLREIPRVFRAWLP